MEIREINLGNDTRQGKQKKRFKKVTFWLKSFIILLFVISVLLLAALSSFFNINSIIIRGSRHYKEEILKEKSGLFTGANGFKSLFADVESFSDIGKLLTLRFALAEKSILKSCPYIKSVQARFLLPETIEISVVERQPSGIVPYMGANLVIDDEGYVLDTLQQSTNEMLPLIMGLKFENYEVGQALKMKNISDFKLVISLLKLLKESDENYKTKIYSWINYIDVSNPTKVCAYVDSRIVVNFGDIGSLNYDTLLYRVNFFKQIFTKNLGQQDKGLVDFTLGDNPKFIPEN